MALERRDPIPPGVYWVDITSPEAARAFHDWMQTYSWGGAALKGLKSQETFRLFEVKHPTPRWSLSSGLGVPTIATPDMSKSDTVQRPDPEPGLLWLPSFEGMGTSVLLLGAVYLLSRK